MKATRFHIGDVICTEVVKPKRFKVLAIQPMMLDVTISVRFLKLVAS